MVARPERRWGCRRGTQIDSDAGAVTHRSPVGVFHLSELSLMSEPL